MKSLFISNIKHPNHTNYKKMWEIGDVSNNVCDGEHQKSLEKKETGFFR